MAVAAAASASGEDFPLTFRTIPAKDVMSFPGGSGSYGLLQVAKPTKLRKEPKAMSRHPLYGECRDAPPERLSSFASMSPKGTARATTGSLWI